MNRCLRSALLTGAALSAAAFGPLTVAAAGSDRASPNGADRWRLRPADVTTTGSTGPSPKDRPAFAIPDERRAVRVVYPGLLGER